MEDIYINNITNYLKLININPTKNNTYIYIIIFIQKIQLINNFVKILSNNKYNDFIFCVKFLLINNKLINNDSVNNLIKNFKNNFDKTELLSEIMSFIKKTINIPAIDFETNIEIIKPNDLNN